MMDYGVKRLDPDNGEMPRYHLFDERGRLLLEAEQERPQPADARRQVRLSRPGGKLLASIDLPAAAEEVAEVGASTDYALVHDYAVYAIITQHHRPVTEEQEAARLYFTLEVEGEEWLALSRPEPDECYALYDAVPTGLNTYNVLTELDLPPVLGRIYLTDDEYDFGVKLDPQRLEQTALVVLALVLLIDRAL